MNLNIYKVIYLYLQSCVFLSLCIYINTVCSAEKELCGENRKFGSEFIKSWWWFKWSSEILIRYGSGTDYKHSLDVLGLTVITAEFLSEA